MKVLGLDIGGANLKVAHTDGTARTVPFALWKQPRRLPAALRELVAAAPAFERVAVTMTGELCDCYETKREGVHAILDAVVEVFGGVPVQVWHNDGHFIDVETAQRSAYEVASANWLATATVACSWLETDTALLIDVGSTTTDIIPLAHGKPVPQGRTDPDRLLSGELVYRGARRTPILWSLRQRTAAELFATMLDAYLLLGEIAEDPNDQGTADERAATRKNAHRRLARMLGGDAETITEAATLQLARKAAHEMFNELVDATEAVANRLPALPGTVVIAGSGEFLARQLVEHQLFMPPPVLVSLSARLGPELSTAAAAYAVAVLAAERWQ